MQDTLRTIHQPTKIIEYLLMSRDLILTQEEHGKIPRNIHFYLHLTSYVYHCGVSINLIQEIFESQMKY